MEILIPSEMEIEEASETLKKILFSEHNEDEIGEWLQKHLEERTPGIEKIIASLEDHDTVEVRYLKIPKLMTEVFGSELFLGKYGGILRDKIFDRLFEEEKFNKIFDIWTNSFSKPKSREMDINEFRNDKKAKTTECLINLKDHKKAKWKPGKRFANCFTDKLGFPRIFAGMKGENTPPRSFSVPPKIEMKSLADFQENMKTQIIEILEGRGKKRAIVTLPTGAGKTRLAVESIIEYLNRHGTDRNILWIAQSEEVCEQAVLCFEQIWRQMGKDRELEIFRLWGNNDVPSWDERGIIVASYQKLGKKLDELGPMIEDDALSAVIIDEAHHAVAPTYESILEQLGMAFYGIGNEDESDMRVPLIGLTATPERSKSSETRKLEAIFGDKRIHPSNKFSPEGGEIAFDENWKDLKKMRDMLIKMGYLAKPNFVPISSGYEKDTKILTEEETKKYTKHDEGWTNSIATDTRRNINILNEIKKWASDPTKKILYFGTNVSQAVSVANILKKEKISSACITADTSYGTRKSIIKTFNDAGSNAIQVLCNYNVLSTGFDSPKIDTVIIARPTTSIVAYQQMIGRGLRGERFGGKKECNIVTVNENIQMHNGRLIETGYQQYMNEVLEKNPEEKIVIPVIGEVLTNDEIYERFRVQKQGGIRYSTKHNFVILVDSNFSNYQDTVDEKNGTIAYKGTGEEDQVFDKGVGFANASVKKENSRLLYFVREKTNHYVFKHEAVYESHKMIKEKNLKGVERTVIQFILKIKRHECPNCGNIASTEEEVANKFGYRMMRGINKPQSWCRECR